MPEKPLKNQVVQMPTAQELEDIMTRGVSEVIPQDVFKKKLLAGERMRIYLGVDPTGPIIHLGHAVSLRKLRILQDLGHEIILLIGDFTARVGDPTGRDAARNALTHEDVLENARTYQEQAALILDFSPNAENPARLAYNAEWLDMLRFQDILGLASQFTVQQMLERDMFKERVNAEKPIYVHEFLYPIMQGYDSVAMNVDMEIGGNDQLFNMLTGRTLQKQMNNTEKVVMTMELLPGLDGRKMSKSYDNMVGVSDSPQEMFGKIMSLKDELIPQFFWLCTNSTKQDIEGMEHALKKGQNPRDLKMCLARTIIELYHSAAAAQEAEDEFVRVFRSKDKPTDIPPHRLGQDDVSLVALMINAGLAPSKAQARRLIEQGGVKLNDEKIVDVNAAPEFADGDVLQVGKRKFIRIILV